MANGEKFTSFIGACVCRSPSLSPSLSDEQLLNDFKWY